VAFLKKKKKLFFPKNKNDFINKLKKNVKSNKTKALDCFFEKN